MILFVEYRGDRLHTIDFLLVKKFISNCEKFNLNMREPIVAIETFTFRVLCKTLRVIECVEKFTLKL